jgi:hypothetical protein
VIGPVARATAGLIVAPFLLVASALAPTHVHEPGPGHDHDRAVAHSHFAPHHVESHDPDDIEIEQDAEHVVWLDSSILHESPYKAASAPPSMPVAYETVVVEAHWSVTPFDDAAPVHGPPKSAALFRGPPLLLA